MGTPLAKLQTIPGIGFLTALWIVTTINFSLCSSAEQAVAYAGLAPMPRESGTSIHKRPCIGHTGNGQLRAALYLATLSAARYNPIIKPFYDRLRAAGKPVKVGSTAAARKLVHVAFAVASNQEDFDPLYQTKRQQPAVVSSLYREHEWRGNTHIFCNEAYVLLTMRGMGVKVREVPA